MLKIIKFSACTTVSVSCLIDFKRCQNAQGDPRFLVFSAIEKSYYVLRTLFNFYSVKLKTIEFSAWKTVSGFVFFYSRQFIRFQMFSFFLNS
jgi:hypothetical protein